eukprot:130206-Amphidinium_carterae.1
MKLQILRPFVANLTGHTHAKLLFGLDGWVWNIKCTNMNDVTGKRLADFMMVLEDYEHAARLMASCPRGDGVPSSINRLVSVESAGR